MKKGKFDKWNNKYTWDICAGHIYKCWRALKKNGKH